MGIFVIDKPLHLTSHDVVAKLRKQLGTRKVGHTGTLDPLATGVLLVLSDEATKLAPFVVHAQKRYVAWISFGASTPTLDAQGPISEQDLAAAQRLTQADIARALPSFLTLTEQVPPAYSAIKKNGVKGYEAARAGTPLTLPPRPARYVALEHLAFAPTQQATIQQATAQKHTIPSLLQAAFQQQLPAPLGNFPTVCLDVTVHAGTYIRALARDLGAALNTPAHLSGLVRTAIATGHHKADASAAPALTLVQAQPLADITPATVGLSALALLPYPTQMLTETDVVRIRQGQRLPLLLSTRTALVDEDQKLVAIAETQAGRMNLLRVWHTSP